MLDTLCRMYIYTTYNILYVPKDCPIMFLKLWGLHIFYKDVITSLQQHLVQYSMLGNVDKCMLNGN